MVKILQPQQICSLGFSDDGVYYGDGYDYTNYEYNSESFARYQAEVSVQLCTSVQLADVRHLRSAKLY